MAWPVRIDKKEDGARLLLPVVGKLVRAKDLNASATLIKLVLMMSYPQHVERCDSRVHRSGPVLMASDCLYNAVSYYHHPHTSGYTSSIFGGRIGAETTSRVWAVQPSGTGSSHIRNAGE